MQFSDISYFSAITASFLTLTGYFLTFLIIKSYSNSKSRKNLILALVIFSASTSWITGLINLILYHFGYQPLSGLIYAVLVTIGMGMTLPGLIYLCISIVKEEWVKIFMIPTIILAVIYYIVNLILFPLGVLQIQDILKVVPGSDPRFPDSTFQGYNIFYSTIAILSGVIFGVILIFIGLRTDIDFVKYRSYFMGTGLLMFAGFATLDALYLFTISELWLLILTRFGVLLGMILLSIGVTMPAFLLIKIHTKE